MKTGWLYINVFTMALGLYDTPFSQNYITNPGFEGPDGIELIPEDWFAGCGVMNTPDTQPGWWNIENKPYEGKSYIDLLYKEDGTTESVYQKLAQPLTAGACYLLEIHLAQACQDSLSGLYHYDLNNPGDLIIRGSTTYGCGNGQILAKFEQVSNCAWKKYYAVFQADSTINYIYLEFSKGASPSQNGSILIDYFVLENIHPLPDQVLEINYTNTVQLQASVNGTSYFWVQNDILINQDSSAIEVEILANSVIQLTYFSEDSCLITEKFYLYVKPQIPNIITPTGNDGINDVFLVAGLVENSSLYILNRWGEEVYFESPYTNSWSAEGLVPGVYFYRLDLNDSRRSFQGFVTVQ